MKKNSTKADLFNAMGLGPVWELKSPAMVVNENNPADEPVIKSEIKPASKSVAEPEIIPADMKQKAEIINLVDLKTLRGQVASCRACSLFESRTQTVFSDGVQNSPLMVIGEAPGAEEDASGLPFVGRAGQLLDKMLQAVGSSRQKNVYIANVLKCRPPGNRNPELEEIAQCSGYLFQQIMANQPKVLLLVGKFAIQTLLNSKQTVGDLRGKVHIARVGDLKIPAVVTYHPAYLLRRPEEKAKAWEDLLLLKTIPF